MNVTKRLLPKSSRRRSFVRRSAGKFFRISHSLENFILNELLSEGSELRNDIPKSQAKAPEGKKLKDSWVNFDPEILTRYLVAGYQNPRINAQSILTRHYFISQIFGGKFDALMKEELETSVDLNNRIRLRAKEMNVKIGCYTDPKKMEAVAQVCQVIAGEESRFEELWAKKLNRVKGKSLSVLEYACGSANDYRAFVNYGLGPFLEYGGIDLNDNNIANAKRWFPDVPFRVGSILELPEPKDTYDYVLAFDIFEHLSIEAMEKALSEAIRVSRKGLVLSFFNMSNIPDHIVKPVRNYHWNHLSMPKIKALLEKHFETVSVTHIPAMLKSDYGYAHSYNSRAYTMIAETPKTKLS